MSKTTRNWPDLTRRIASDSFTITGPDGQEYHPHAGEWVLVRQHLTPGLMHCSLKFWGARSNLSQETAWEYADATAEMASALAEALLDWNWRGPDGELYPKPSAETLNKRLCVEEIAWLVNQIQTKPEPGANPTSPPSSS